MSTADSRAPLRDALDDRAVIRFTKGHGTGNDFVLFTDEHGEIELTPTRVRALADRRFGVGGDGVIRAIRTSALPEGASLLAEEPEAQWFMDYRNADGSVAEMCGNGVRVFAAYLLAEGLAELAPGDTLPIATRAGVRDVQRSSTGFQVDLGRWRLARTDPLVTTAGIAVDRPGLGVDLGNPHVVVALQSAGELEAADLTREPRLTPALPEGANIEYAVPAEPLVRDGLGCLTMRVFERGAGETLSCGTGAAAAALAMRHWAGPEAPANWRVEVPGGTLGVRMFATEEGEHVGLAGPAELVFSGEFSLPRWAD